jgi:hypothetical protein
MPVKEIFSRQEKLPEAPSGPATTVFVEMWLSSAE